ncbi:hypothetical protein, partial [Pseudochrobactrum sp. HB0163]|uniref:hypothetical protein n=1 Tax=Pseudochrobactrum sp. HB0163 TaxID=3450708 RepID=UPI003F6DE84B
MANLAILHRETFLNFPLNNGFFPVERKFVFCVVFLFLSVDSFVYGGLYSATTRAALLLAAG